MYDLIFDIVGDTISLNKDALDNDQLYFLGVNADFSGFDDIPESIDIQAIATFNNGNYAERVVTIDLSGMATMLVEYWSKPE